MDNAFVNSFLGGYSTGDVLVSFLAAGVFFDSIKRKGYEGEAFRKAHVRACLIAAVCLAIVYGGLLYMGACVSTEYTPDSISNANLLLAIIRSSGGQIAIYGLCLSVVLAAHHRHQPGHLQWQTSMRPPPTASCPTRFWS